MRLLSALLDRAAQHRTRSDLLQLDDHLLRDIGLSRHDLHLMMAGQRTSHAKGTRSHG